MTQDIKIRHEGMRIGVGEGQYPGEHHHAGLDSDGHDGNATDKRAREVRDDQGPYPSAAMGSAG